MVLAHCCTEGLDQLVKNAIKVGWQPYGDLKVASHPDQTIEFFQPIVFYEEPEEHTPFVGGASFI